MVDLAVSEACCRASVTSYNSYYLPYVRSLASSSYSSKTVLQRTGHARRSSSLNTILLYKFARFVATKQISIQLNKMFMA